MIAARLKMLGVKALIVDQNERIGDVSSSFLMIVSTYTNDTQQNWRNRYHQLVLHDPIW